MCIYILVYIHKHMYIYTKINIFIYLFIFYFNLTSLGYQRGKASKTLHVSFTLIIILEKKKKT